MSTRTTHGTVLIIEDDKKTASLVALYLEREGFQTVIAYDGEKGLQMAEVHDPVFVILDLIQVVRKGRKSNLFGFALIRRYGGNRISPR